MTPAGELPGWLWPVSIYGVAFLLGASTFLRLFRGRRWPSAAAQAGRAPPPSRRPAAQLAVMGYEELVAATGTGDLIASIEQRMRLSQENFRDDAAPVLRALAEFVQLLPASESHHHAQPGGLLIHALECADIALAFRAAAELPPGRPTELRKKLEHRWTYAVLLAALLHDLGKPVTDVVVTAYGEDPRAGRPWAPLAGTLREAGARYYRVDFAGGARRDYALHQKLPAVLMQRMVPQRVMQWLSEDAALLEELFAYLAGEARPGPIADLARRADAESVRRNLRSGPRTRFASARVVPLIERLMEALRRMLAQGGALVLNRKGAHGWVHDGAVWFVCARLADEVRAYLEQHESGEALPPKDKNDRLFDVWQEYGALDTHPDTGGAVWTVVVECDGWTSPALTVLRFPLERLFASPAEYPPPVKGRVVVQPRAALAAGQPAPATPALAPAPGPETLAILTSSLSSEGAAAPEPPASRVAAASAAMVQCDGSPAATAGGAAVMQPDLGNRSSAAPRARRAAVEPAAAVLLGPPAAAPVLATAEGAVCSAVEDNGAEQRAAQQPRTEEIAAPAAAVVGVGDGLLAAHEAARLEPVRPASAPAGASLPAPRHAFDGVAHETLRKAPELAIRFMNWVAAGVGSGEIRHNESGSLVHFCDRGALVLTPETFRRFVQLHAAAAEGALAQAIAEGEDKAISRVQAALRKAGWLVRNGDQNIHYYTFPKSDGSQSRRSSFVLIGVPHLFWNPVPPPNPRLQRLPDPPRSLPLAARPRAAARVA